jgi:hypothetical protein
MDNDSVWNVTFMVYVCEASKQEENQSLPSAENICSSCKTSIIPYTDLNFTLNKKSYPLFDTFDIFRQQDMNWFRTSYQSETYKSEVYFTPLLALKLITCRIKHIYRWKNEKFEDTNGVIRNRYSKDNKHNDQTKKDKQRSTKH